MPVDGIGHLVDDGVMETTTTHPAEAAHDAILLDLLRSYYMAAEQAATVTSYVLSRVTEYHKDYRGHIDYSPQHGTGRSVTEVPEGTIYGDHYTNPKGPTQYRVSTSERWDRLATVEEALALLDGTERVVTMYHDAIAARDAARQAIDAHEVAYTGWARFVLVTSSAGHVHSSMHCSTCHLTTTYAPVVQLSGCTEAEAVDLLGSTLCTVCFPTAPVEGKVAKITKAQANKLVGK